MVNCSTECSGEVAVAANRQLHVAAPHPEDVVAEIFSATIT
jgi:hypothetical protein